MKGPLGAALLALVLASCAQVREPQGGPKDTTAPQLLAAEPANGSTGFAAERIVLHFDERIKLDRVRDRLLVSPPLAAPPEVVISRGSDVIIRLKAPLAPNTTYTFNIGEAVLDLSEGNVAAGLAYVVSTGTHLDSLSVHGRAMDAASSAPAAGVFVLLHDTADTAGVVRGTPAYFTRTDAQGRFTLSHLRPGRFRITALRDQNADFRYDLPNEDIAFDARLVDPADTLPWRLFLFRPLAAEQQVLEARVLPDRGWRIVFARPAPEATLHALDREGGVLQWWPRWNATRDTAVFWPSDTTLLADQRFAISEAGRVLDTLTYRVTQRMPFNLTAQVATDAVDKSQYLLASRPLASLHAGQMHLHTDTVDRPFTAEIDPTDHRIVRVSPPLALGESATLELLPMALMDTYGGTNDTLRLALGSAAAMAFGDLRVRVKGDSTTTLSGPFVLQLLGAQGDPAREERITALPHTSEWRLLAPGAYTLRLIEDRNGDGRWTTGSFMAGIQPERTYVQTDPVTVRAKWDVEVEWTIVP